MTQRKGMQDHYPPFPRKRGLRIAQSFWMIRCAYPSGRPAGVQRAMRFCPAFAGMTTIVQLLPGIPTLLGIHTPTVISASSVIPAKAGIQYSSGAS